MEEKNEKAQLLDDCGLRPASATGFSATCVWGRERRLFVYFPHILLWCASADDVRP